MRRFVSTPLVTGIATLVSFVSAAAAEFSLSGTVVDQVTGAPVRHARVSLRPTGDQVDSDASGAFQFSHLAAGPYTVAVSKTGFEDEGVYVQLSASQTGLAIQLTPLAAIRGKIADDEGEPVEGVVVLALRSQVEQGFRRYVVVRQSTTDDRGQYRIPLLPAGRYLVQAAGRDEHTFFGETNAAHKTHAAFAPVYFGGARDRASAMVLPITPGQEPHADFSLTLQAAHRITGQIANLKPFSQPTLQLLSGDEDLGLNRSSLQPATGYFEIHDVLDGAYRLRVLGVGAANQPLVAEQEIRVSGGDVEDVALALGPGVTVKGSVRIDGPVVEDASQALQGFYLQLDAPEDIRALGVEDFESETEVDGAFQIPRVIPGAYRVRFEVLGSSSLYVSSARAGDQDLLATPELVLRNGLPPEIEIVLRSDGGSIEGMLASGIRDDEACLLLIPESLNRPTDATCTDDDGTFEFTAVAPGSYRLHAWNGLEEVESIEYNAPAVRAMLAAGGMRVEVRPSTKTEVQLRTLSKAPL